MLCRWFRVEDLAYGASPYSIYGGCTGEQEGWSPAGNSVFFSSHEVARRKRHNSYVRSGNSACLHGVTPTQHCTRGPPILPSHPPARRGEGRTVRRKEEILRRTVIDVVQAYVEPRGVPHSSPHWKPARDPALCRRCHKAPHEKGVGTCDSCRAYERAKAAIWRADAREICRCLVCKEPLALTKSGKKKAKYCEKHLQYYRQRNPKKKVPLRG